MIFEKFLAASLLSSAHIALSENLPFSLSLLHPSPTPPCIVLPASCFLHGASCMLMADHRSHSHRITSCMLAVWFSLLLFWFAWPFPFLPSFLSFLLPGISLFSPRPLSLYPPCFLSSFFLLSFPPPSPVAVLTPVRNSSSSLSSHNSSEMGNVGNLLILADGMVVEHPEDFYRMQVSEKRDSQRGNALVASYKKHSIYHT